MLDNISVLGDSILRGVVLDEATKKYKFLKQGAVSSFEKMYQVSVTNYSKFGCTAKKGLEKLQQILKSDEPSEAVLIELGGNDCDFDWEAVCTAPEGEPHAPNTPYGEFVNLIRTIIEDTLKGGKRPFFMNLPPIDSDMYFAWIAKGDPNRAQKLLSFLGDKNYIYRHQELYSRAIEHLAHEYNLYLIDIRDKFLAIPKYSDFLCADGIHPNAKGQELIKEAFSNAYLERGLV